MNRVSWWTLTEKRRCYVKLGFLRMCAFLPLSAGLAEGGEPNREKGDSAARHPISALMGSVTWQLRPELQGVHPRVYVTRDELRSLRERARTTHRKMWQEVTEELGALEHDPPPPPAQDRRAQNTVAIRLAEIAFAWAIEEDPRYLEAAKKYMEAAISYDVWGYTTNKPDVDLAAGHLLYALGWAYDLLYDQLTPDERARCRKKLVRQGELLYRYFTPEAGRTYAYAQNHLFIPVAGLAVAGYALQGEAPEAEGWSKLARALYDRVLTTYSPDGYYYEGFEYWIFATPWLIHFLDAHAHATGEDLYARAPGLAAAHLYVAHEMLPGGDDAFDFGDAFAGPASRTGQDKDRERTHPDGHFLTNYNLLYRLADRFDAPDAQGVADFMRSVGQVNAESFWSLIWYDPALPATPMADLPLGHHFPDHDVVYWRTGWGDRATALAFKCGPPHGHRAAELLPRLPDWQLSAGHAHPDANSFILVGRGAYLSGDSGYAGMPRTDQHNTLLIDGQGQAREGDVHDVWKGYPYARLDAIRITQFSFEEDGVFVQGDATTAYDSSLGVERFVRSFLVTDTNSVTMWDDVETNRPRTITSLLHADGKIRVEGDLVEFTDGDARLSVRPLTPAVSLGVEPNVLVGPGPPGALHTGPTQVRGERARVTTLSPITRTTIVYRMRIDSR